MKKIYIFITILILLGCSYKNFDNNNTERTKFEIRYDSLQQAVKNYTNLLKQQPDDIELLTKRAIAFRKLNMYISAFSDINKAIEIDPNSAKLYFERGLINYYDSDYSSAVSDLRKALKIDSTNVDTYFRLAYSYAAQNNLKNSIYYLDKALAIDSTNYEIYEYRGRCHYCSFNEKERIELALIDFNKAIELNPDYAIAYFHRGCVYWVYNPELALSDYNKAIELGFKNDDIHSYRKLVIDQIDKNTAFRIKIEDFTSLIKSDSTNADTYYERGETYYNQGEFQNAYEDICKYLDLENDGKYLKKANMIKILYERNEVP